MNKSEALLARIKDGPPPDSLATLHAISSLIMESRWLPIVTAPLDGTMIVLCNNGDDLPGCDFTPEMDIGMWVRGGWFKNEGWRECEGRINTPGPTHWQPLPCPPSRTN